MKNFPRKLDSKTTNLRITVPENLDLALEGLIRKVLKEQPKTDDIYSFAADYFETLLKIRDKAGAKYMSSQICSFHNDEDAHEMIKMANSFPKPRTASDEGKNEQEPGKAVPSGKSLVTKEPEKVNKGSRVAGDKRKPPVGRIKSSTNAKSKTVPSLAKPIAEAVTKPILQEPKVKDEKEDKLVTEPESNLQDIGEDEEFLKSDPIKELVERELMSKTTQKDINRDKGQPSTDMTGNEKLESEKAVDKVPEVIEPHGNDELKDKLESKDNRKDEASEGEPTAIGDELCGVVDVLSIPRALEGGNETTTTQKDENKEEINLNESDKEKTEEGGQAIETPRPATEEVVKEADKSTSDKPELVTNEKMEDLKEEKPDDEMVKQEEDIEKKEINNEGEKPNESTDDVQEGKEEINEIKGKQGDTEDIIDRSKEDAEGNKDKPKEDAIDKLENDPEDNKNKFKEDGEDNEDKPKEGTEDIKDKLEDDTKDKIKEGTEDNKDKPKEGEEDNKEKPNDAEDNKDTSTEKEETDTITNKKEEEIPSEKPNVEVKETDDTVKTTQEAEKETGDISQTNITAIPDGSKVESANETKEKQKDETENQTSLPEENSSQEETTKEEISNEKPLTDSKEPIEKQEDKEIKTQIATDTLLKTTEADNTPDNKQIIENDSEKNYETTAETKELVEEELQKTEEISSSLGETKKITETDAETTTTEKPEVVNETHSQDKEDINRKSENTEENHIKDVVAIDESLKETKEEVIEKEETKPESESVMKKEDEEPEKPKAEGETGIISTEDEKKADETEKPTSETDQQDDKPKIIVSTEEEPVGDENENKSNTEIEVEKEKPIEEKPEPIDQEKTENKPEEKRIESEQLSNPESEITETGIELKENNNEESEESNQLKTEEEPEKELPPGSELKAEVETLGEKAVPEVEVETTEFKPDEVKETEKLSTQVDTTVNKESIAAATPDKDDKDLVKDERQKTPNDEDESKTKTEETQQTEETENLKGEENIPPHQDNSKEPKENENTDSKTENITKEIVEENKPEDTTNQDIVPNEEKTETETIEPAEENKPEDTTKKDIEPNEERTETHEPITEATAEGELCTVVDAQNLTKPEDGITIKTITTHYYDLLQVPTTVTKEFKVHRTEDKLHDLSNVGNTIIKSYQLVKELTSDGDNNNNQQTVFQDISPGIGSTNQTQETEVEPGIQKDEIEGLNAIPTSGELYTMHELFLDSERKLSSYQKEGPKLSSLKTAKQSLEDTKIQAESPKTPPADENKQEVEEIITKTVIPRIPEAVPDPPREVEEINAETNTEQTDHVKDKKEDDKPDTNSSEDSNEPTDSSNNGRSIDSDVPIISVEVRTVIETQILDDDEEAIEDTQKSSDYRTELTLTDGSTDVNVEVEATIQVPLETTDSEIGHNQNLTDQEKTRQQQQTKEQTNNQEKPEIKLSNDDSEPRGSSTVRDGSSGESDSTTLTAATEIKRFDSARKNFARSSTQDLLTSQSLDSGKRPPLLKTRSLSVFRQGVTDFEIWNTIEKELEEAATKIQSKYRGYTVRKRLRREDAVQITTEESSVSTTPGEQEPHLDGDDLRTTGEFHDSIVLSIYPR